MRRRVYEWGQGAWPRARRMAVATVGSVLLAAQAGCGLVSGPTAFQPDNITVTSSVLSGGIIPARYTCHGARVSPPLHWSGVGAGTKSLALVVDDSDAPITPYIYWIVFNINPTTTDIQQGQLPLGARQGVNSAGHAAYNAPCPRNHEHAYRFTVYALDSVLSLPNGASLKSAWPAIARAAVARGRLTANVEP